MNNQERYKITSEEFADLIIDSTSDNVFDFNKEEVSVNEINKNYSIMYLSVKNMTENSIYKFGYHAIPKLYGLTTYTESLAENGYSINNYFRKNYTGKGVLIGFIDTGIDYTNPVFQYPDKSSRIVSIWDQTIDSNNYPKDMYYGTEYDKDEIDMAILNANPLSIVPSTDDIGQGTAMAGVAVGKQDELFHYTGVANNAELVVVKLKPAKMYLRDFWGIPDESICYQENDIMMGIKYLIQVSNRFQKPIVICFGLGSWQGSHSGEDIISEYISNIAYQNGVGFAIGTANSGNSNNHFYAEIIPPITDSFVELNVGYKSNFTLEIWGFAPNILTLELFSPAGEMVFQLPEDVFQKNTRVVVYGDTKIYVDNINSDNYTGNQLIVIRFKQCETGIWRFQIKGTDDLVDRYHIWLPINTFLPKNVFFYDANPYTTITIIGNIVNIVTITAYNPFNYTLYDASGRGFTKNNHPKPDIAAPGVNILAPTLDNNFKPNTGTGIAAAYAAGLMALLLEWGIVDGNVSNMNSMTLRYIMATDAQRSNDIQYPDPNWGFGLVE